MVFKFQTNYIIQFSYQKCTECTENVPKYATLEHFGMFDVPKLYQNCTRNNGTFLG